MKAEYIETLNKIIKDGGDCSDIECHNCCFNPIDFSCFNWSNEKRRILIHILLDK